MTLLNSALRAGRTPAAPARDAANARADAKRYAAFSPAEQRRRIIARIEALLAERGAILPPPTTRPGTER
jgi:hypothetical protein